jgi:Glucodextranase, domain B
MKQERVILSFIMVLIGLLVAGVAFYLYQGTKTIPASKLRTVSVTKPSPTVAPLGVYLNVDSPQDESVVGDKVLSISGKTVPGATVVILTSSSHQVVQPSQQGDFSTTINLDDGENLIRIISFGPDGLSTTVERTVTFSTEDF